MDKLKRVFTTIRKKFYKFEHEESNDKDFSPFAFGFIISATLTFIIIFLVNIFGGNESILKNSFFDTVNYTWFFIINGIISKILVTIFIKKKYNNM